MRPGSPALHKWADLPMSTSYEAEVGEQVRPLGDTEQDKPVRPPAPASRLPLPALQLPKCVLLILICLIFYIPGLFTIPPLDRDEARYAQATKQMVESHDFVRISFQNTPRNKKPIGIYWLQAASVELSGGAQCSKNLALPHSIAFGRNFFRSSHLCNRKAAFWGKDRFSRGDSLLELDPAGIRGAHCDNRRRAACRDHGLPDRH